MYSRIRIAVVSAIVGIGSLTCAGEARAQGSNYISGYSNGMSSVYGWPGYDSRLGYDYLPGYRDRSSDAAGINRYYDPGDDTYPVDQIPLRSPAYRGLGFGDEEYYGGYGFPRYGRYGNQGSNGYYW